MLADNRVEPFQGSFRLRYLFNRISSGFIYVYPLRGCDIHLMVWSNCISEFDDQKPNLDANFRGFSVKTIQGSLGQSFLCNRISSGFIYVYPLRGCDILEMLWTFFVIAVCFSG